MNIYKELDDIIVIFFITLVLYSFVIYIFEKCQKYYEEKYRKNNVEGFIGDIGKKMRKISSNFAGDIPDCDGFIFSSRKNIPTCPIAVVSWAFETIMGYVICFVCCGICAYLIYSGFTKGPGGKITEAFVNETVNRIKGDKGSSSSSSTPAQGPAQGPAQAPAQAPASSPAPAPAPAAPPASAPAPPGQGNTDEDIIAEKIERELIELSEAVKKQGGGVFFGSKEKSNDPFSDMESKINKIVSNIKKLTSVKLKKRLNNLVSEIRQQISNKKKAKKKKDAAAAKAEKSQEKQEAQQLKEQEKLEAQEEKDRKNQEAKDAKRKAEEELEQKAKKFKDKSRTESKQAAITSLEKAKSLYGEVARLKNKNPNLDPKIRAINREIEKLNNMTEVRKIDRDIEIFDEQKRLKDQKKLEAAEQKKEKKRQKERQKELAEEQKKQKKIRDKRIMEEAQSEYERLKKKKNDFDVKKKKIKAEYQTTRFTNPFVGRRTRLERNKQIAERDEKIKNLKKTTVLSKRSLRKQIRERNEKAIAAHTNRMQTATTSI